MCPLCFSVYYSYLRLKPSCPFSDIYQCLYPCLFETWQRVNFQNYVLHTFTNKWCKQNKYSGEFIDWLETLLLQQSIMSFAKYGTFKCFKTVRVDCWPWPTQVSGQELNTEGPLPRHYCTYIDSKWPHQLENCFVGIITALLNNRENVHAITCCFLPSARYTFASGSADNIKQWMFPDGNFIQNLSGHNAIINTLAVNSDGVLVSGGNQ